MFLLVTRKYKLVVKTGIDRKLPLIHLHIVHTVIQINTYIFLIIKFYDSGTIKIKVKYLLLYHEYIPVSLNIFK